MDETLAVIGIGNMGEAIISGLLTAQKIDAQRVICADQSRERLTVMSERYGVQTATTTAAVRAASVVLLAVKPQNLAALLQQIGDEFTDGQTVVSIVAGIPTPVYQAAIRAAVSVVRAMPNTPAQLGVGVTAITAASGATPAAMTVAEAIFASVGTVVVVDEQQLDAVTAVSGSGPAYVFLFAEALIDAAVAAGLDTLTARTLAIETLFGSSMMLRQSGREPHELRAMVSSPGGTTVAALQALDAAGFRQMMHAAVAAATSRAAELAGEIT